MKKEKLLINLMTLGVATSLFEVSSELVSAIDAEVNNSGLMKIVNGFKDMGYDEYFNFIEKTSDGGIIICGKKSNQGFIVKFNKNGSIAWSNKLGDNSSDTKIYKVIEISDGGFVAVGASSSKNIGVTNTTTNAVPIIVKYSQDGQQEWIKSFGNGGMNVGFKSVIELEDGSLVAVGADMVQYKNGAIMAKFSSTGDLLKNIDFRGTGDDSFSDIIQLSDGSLIVVGKTESKGTIESVSIPNGGAIALKYDSEFNLQWGSSYGNASNYSRFNSVLEMSDGNIAVIGNFNSILFYNPEGTKIGELEWSERFSELNSIKKTMDGGFIVTVEYSNSMLYYSEAFLMKFNKDGQREWTEKLRGDGSTYFKDVIEISEDNYAVIGYTDSTDIGFENEPSNRASIIVEYKKITPEMEAEVAVSNVEEEPTVNNMIIARGLVNGLDESETKDDLQDRLNIVEVEMELTKKNATANVDVYIKSENMLKLSLDTNSVTFEDFSGVVDMKKPNAVNLTVSSSLPYKVDAYLATDIQNATKDKTMNKEILKIKANNSLESEYKSFTDVNITPITLLDDQIAGNDVVHGIDLMLKGNLAHEKDVYKTTIKFEVGQK